jgi:hypothetical protein
LTNFINYLLFLKIFKFGIFFIIFSFFLFSFPSFSFPLLSSSFSSSSHEQQNSREQQQGARTEHRVPSAHGPPPPPSSHPHGRPKVRPLPLSSFRLFLLSRELAMLSLMELQLRPWPPPMESLTQSRFSSWDDQNGCI